MKTFKSFSEEVNKPTGKLKSACWTGYTAIGTKEKNGKTVPNCVPVKEATDDDVGEMVKDKLQIIINRAQEMHDSLKDTDDLPEWVKSKVTLAQDYISTACDYSCGTKEVKEDMGAGAVSSGPTNVVGGGDIAGTGGRGGEPGVDLSKRKKKISDPRLRMGIVHRKPPQ